MPKFKLTVKGVTSSTSISVTAPRLHVTGNGISFLDETNTIVEWVPQEALIGVVDEEARK